MKHLDLRFQPLRPQNYSELVSVLLDRFNQVYPDYYVTGPNEDLEALSELLPKIVDGKRLDDYVGTDLGKGILIGLLTAYIEIKELAEHAVDGDE